MTTETENPVASLDAFRQKAKFSKPPEKDERVWDRVERLYGLSCAQNPSNTPHGQRLETWEVAVNALLQYISNEWPIEKHNKVRADDIAEKSATLFVKGALGFPQSSKSTQLQSTLIDAFEDQGFPDALMHYRKQVTALIDANMMMQTHSPGYELD